MIKVLDHGYVKFIGSMGTEETIIEAARMSTGKGFERWDPGDVCAHFLSEPSSPPSPAEVLVLKRFGDLP